jgi:hypothetical protein
MSFDMSINKILSTISDAVIIISPAKINQNKFVSNPPLQANLNNIELNQVEIEGFGTLLQHFYTDSNQNISMNFHFKEMI